MPFRDDQRADGAEFALVEMAQSNPDGFSQLYECYLPRIYRYLRVRSANDEVAADLTQQVFLKAFEALPNYRPRGIPFAAWLFRIARNALTDSYRRPRGVVSIDELAEALEQTGEDSPEAAVLHQEALTRLHALLGGLDSDKRELLELRFAAQLSSREIALVVGKSEAAVKKQLTRTIQTLRRQYLEE
ncbi:MAG: sigma-70 family RNA polymerase sigma factor [Dehalococcoidia bacterium]|nr:sigma-70 family RNA polymerase sigma factor [Dehalococcoidia bacterium]